MLNLDENIVKEVEIEHEYSENKWKAEYNKNKVKINSMQWCK